MNFRSCLSVGGSTTLLTIKLSPISPVSPKYCVQCQILSYQCPNLSVQWQCPMSPWTISQVRNKTIIKLEFSILLKKWKLQYCIWNLSTDPFKLHTADLNVVIIYQCLCCISLLILTCSPWKWSFDTLITVIFRVFPTGCLAFRPSSIFASFSFFFFLLLMLSQTCIVYRIPNFSLKVKSIQFYLDTTRQLWSARTNNEYWMLMVMRNICWFTAFTSFNIQFSFLMH